MTSYEQDKQNDKQTDAFFQQCVDDGQMDQKEYDNLSLRKVSTGRERPEWRKVDINCQEHSIPLTKQDLEIYVNAHYWYRPEIVEYLGITKQTVRSAILRVARQLPELRRAMPGKLRGIPDLDQMLSLDAPSEQATEAGYAECLGAQVDSWGY